jgi:hypothetical protein
MKTGLISTGFQFIFSEAQAIRHCVEKLKHFVIPNKTHKNNELRLIYFAMRQA